MSSKQTMWVVQFDPLMHLLDMHIGQSTFMPVAFATEWQAEDYKYDLRRKFPHSPVGIRKVVL